MEQNNLCQLHHSEQCWQCVRFVSCCEDGRDINWNGRSKRSREAHGATSDQLNFFCADSSLLSLEAMFSFSPAWHVVKDRLHYALNSLESCTSTKELWRIAKWLCPAGSRLHTSTPTVAAAARTSNRKLQQISRIDELQMSGLNEINSASSMCCSDKLLKMMHGSGRTHARSSLRRPAMGKFV